MLRRRRSWRRMFAASAFCVVLAPGGVWAKSVALVIGNQSYAYLGALEKSVEDAEGYAAALRRQGFEVTLLTNLHSGATLSAVAAFVESIRPGDTAAFVFSGHGWSDGAVNYLMPIDMTSAGSQTETQMRSLLLANGSTGVLDLMRQRGATVRLAIIDACRNNPFSDGTKSGFTRGLTRDAGQEGDFIVYSAGPRQLALDKLGPQDRERYSVFTRIFLPYLEQGASLEQAVNASQIQVRDLAARIGHQQTPAYTDGVPGELCLSGVCGSSMAMATPAPAPAPAPYVAPVPTPPPYVAPQPTPALAPQPASAPAATPEATPAHLLPTPGGLAAGFLDRARAGSAADMVNLGIAYMFGKEGVPQSDAEAARWYYAGARAGDVRGMTNIGFMYRNGRGGLPQSDAEAIRWYRAGAEAGDAVAMGNLAAMYEQGRSVPRDLAQVRHWLQKAIFAAPDETTRKAYQEVLENFNRSYGR